MLQRKGLVGLLLNGYRDFLRPVRIPGKPVLRVADSGSGGGNGTGRGNGRGVHDSLSCLFVVVQVGPGYCPFMCAMHMARSVSIFRGEPGRTARGRGLLPPARVRGDCKHVVEFGS